MQAACDYRSDFDMSDVTFTPGPTPGTVAPRMESLRQSRLA